MEIKCYRCGKTFKGRKKGGNEKYCKECGKVHRKEYMASWKENNKGYYFNWNKKNWEENKEKESLRSKKYHQKNREKILARMKEYREANKDYFKNKWKEYYANNKKYLLEQKKLWREKNKEHEKKVRKAYYKSPRGKEVTSYHNRLKKIRLRNIKHGFSLEEWKKKVEDSLGVCPMCNEDVGIENLTLDHILPKSKVPKGFIYKIDDVQPLCHKCNSSKNNNLDEAMREHLIDLSIEQGLI